VKLDTRCDAAQQRHANRRWGKRNASKAHLLDVAQRLDVTGRSRMTKAELVEAIDKANRRARAGRT
jgi:hypothetical protein